MILYEEVLREFHKQKVKYVLVGGIAYNLLGGYRNTLDMDILVKMSNKNLAKVVSILKKEGYHVKQPVDPMGIADKKTREDWINNKHMKAFNFYKGEHTYLEVDLIIKAPVDYEKAVKNAVKVKTGDLTLTVISANDLIEMKRNTGRDLDAKDIKELKALRRRK